MKRLIAFVMLIIFLPNFIFAQNYSWTHTRGPNGGIVGDMVINSSDEIYAGVYGFITPTFEFKYYSGLYKSTDNGNSWNEVETQFDPFEIYALYINKKGHILVGTNHQGRIYRSTDNGVTWENNNGGYNTGECWAFGESNDSILFAGNGEGEVYRSTNYGNNWEFSGSLMSLVFATDSNNTVYCGTHIGLFKTTDNGLNWVQSDSFQDTAVSSILIDSANNIFVSTGYYDNGNGVYYSTDGGNNWIHLGLEGKVVLSLAFDSKGTLYAGTKQDGLFKTTNMGQSWTQHQIGIKGVEVFRLKINSQNHIIIGSENEGVYRSTDDGEYFIQVGLPISHIQNIDFSPDKNFIYASTPSGVQRFNRTTGIWENKGLREVEAVSVSPSGTLYAVTFIAGIYHSTNNGDSWEFISNDVIERYNLKAITDSVLVDAAYPNLRISTNAGSSWDTTSIASDPWASSIFFYDNKIFTHGFMNFQTKIFYTDNLGQSFFEIETPSDVSRKNGFSINSNGEMFFLNRQGNQSPGIYMNTFPPSNWIQKYSGLSNCIYIDTNNFIYTGTTDGVLQSSDYGNNWELIFTENSSRAFAHDLKIEDNSLFIATNSYGLYGLQIPTSVNEETELVTTYQLHQNYPNPFNPTTKIKFSVPESEVVQIKVYDVLGKEMQTLLNEYKQSGSYEVEFDASNLPSGVYFYRMISGSYLETKKMILLR